MALQTPVLAPTVLQTPTALQTSRGSGAIPKKRSSRRSKVPPCPL